MSILMLNHSKCRIAVDTNQHSDIVLNLESNNSTSNFVTCCVLTLDEAVKVRNMLNMEIDSQTIFDKVKAA